MLLLSGCLPVKKTSGLGKKTIFDDPHFYYDKENYTLIRVNPETREKDIEEYINWRDKKSPPPSSTSKNKPSKNDTLGLGTPPEQKKCTALHYPEEAKLRGYQMEILFKMKINSMGIVTLAKLLAFETQFGQFESKLSKITPKNLIKNKSKYIKKPDKIERLLIETALGGVINREFTPAYDEKGKPLPIWISYPVRFILQK